MIRWKALIRDLIIIWILTFLSAVAGLAVADGYAGRVPLIAYAVGTFVFTFIGFTISGCLAKVNRFRHLVSVGVVVWMSAPGVNSVLRLPRPGLTLISWVGGGIIYIAIPLLIGWGLSYIFVKNPKTTRG